MHRQHFHVLSFVIQTIARALASMNRNCCDPMIGGQPKHRPPTYSNDAINDRERMFKLIADLSTYNHVSPWYPFCGIFHLMDIYTRILNIWQKPHFSITSFYFNVPPVGLVVAYIASRPHDKGTSVNFSFFIRFNVSDIDWFCKVPPL